MAKKVEKGKLVKKTAKPAKKTIAKKTAPKKAAKPAKKIIAKKSVKKVVAKKTTPKKITKPAKKIIAKKVIKKVVAKKTTPKKVIKPAKKVIAKKATPKKITKPAKKIIAKKVIKKIVTKKAVKKIAKKITAKPIQKKIAKAVVKAVSKPIVKVKMKKEIPSKPIAVVKQVPPVEKNTEPVFKKKKNTSNNIDWDEEVRDEEPMVVEYKTPSILRPMGPVPTPHINTDKRTRYTDVELKEFKELILKKLAEAQKDFELLKSTLSHKDDHGTDDTSPTFKLLEDGSDVLSKEETAHLAGRQEKFIQNLQNALIRVENKTYGICRVTGRLISKERLRSVPHATLAIEAKLEQNV